MSHDTGHRGGCGSRRGGWALAGADTEDIRLVNDYLGYLGDRHYEPDTTEALRHTDVAVPPTVVLCEDVAVIGSPFAVAEFAPGRTVQSQEDLARLDDDTVAAAVIRLVETLAASHRVDHVAVGLEYFGRPNGYSVRQIRRWAGQWELVGTDNADAWRAAAELGARLASSVSPAGSVASCTATFASTTRCFVSTTNNASRRGGRGLGALDHW